MSLIGAKTEKSAHSVSLSALHSQHNTCHTKTKDQRPMATNAECVFRYGHCNGHTDCTFVDHTRLMTCGVDSEIRIWPIDSNEEADECTDSFPISDQSLAVVCNSINFFIACDDNCVKSYSLSDGENETIVCRFETNATHLDISSDGQLLVASAADFKIKSIDLQTNDQKTFEGHEAPVLSVALDPKRRYIASSSCDTSVRIWNIENGNCVHSWKNCFPKSNDFENSQTLCRISWYPMDGRSIAVPKMDKIEIYKRESWDLLRTFSHQSLTQISIADHSFDGIYLAVGSSDGIITVWSVESAKTEPITQFSCPKSHKITSLKWNPKSSKQICFANINGQFGVLKVNDSIGGQSNGLKLTPEEMNEMFEELSDDDFNDKDEDVAKQDNNDKFKLDKITFNPKHVQTIEKRSETNDKESAEIEISDDLEFDIGAIKSKYESQIFGDSQTTDQPKDRPQEARPQSIAANEEEEIELEPPPLRQEAFQPGSTPIHFNQRFMVWNSVGIIRNYKEENENSIDVEFHDTSYHHSIHLPNAQHNYTIADLSYDSLLLATNGDESDTNGKLYCMSLNVWDAIKEWSIEMPKDEFIEAIACGSGFVAVVTDKRYVRVFTSGGIQTQLLSIAGPVVCLSAFEQYLMVIYHSSSGLPEEQSVSICVYKFDNKPIAKHPVPNPTPAALSPKSLVSWAGFTDEGTPCVVDTDGVVRLYDISDKTWVPIASMKDHAKGKSDNFFVIGLSEIQSQIRCIFCKGSQYPSTVPKPTLTLLPIQMPLCEMFTSKGKHEEEFMRKKLTAKLLKKLSKSGFEIESSLEECNKSLISCSIKLFALALGADRESLAVEISHLMPNKDAVEGAIRYADRQKRRALVQKLSEVAQQKEEEGDEQTEEVVEVEEHYHFENTIRSDVLQVKSSDAIKLKPKPLRRANENSRSNYGTDESESEAEVKLNEDNSGSDDEYVSDDGSNSVSLKPKAVKLSKQSKGNPFKVTAKEEKRDKRKRRRDSSEEGDSDEKSSRNAKKITNFFTRN